MFESNVFVQLIRCNKPRKALAGWVFEHIISHKIQKISTSKRWILLNFWMQVLFTM